MTAEPDKVDLSSPDLAGEKLAALQELFPGVVEDGVLDAARLGELVNLDAAGLKDGRERYGLMWAGKREAVQSLLRPSHGTLVPDVENSVDFDGAENVFIEGDNLEVLKLLQKSYNDQVKLIYIDPPYNTGNDFVYNDDFSDGLRGYLEYTGQLDDDGNRTSANADIAGRQHSRWLSMMYPRLALARNLLTQDGVIFVSIDEHEVHNLCALMDEIFGPENMLACVTVVSNLKGRSDDQYFASCHNYLVVYKRNDFRPLGISLPEVYTAAYSQIDDEGRKYRALPLRKSGTNSLRSDRPFLFYPFFVNVADGSITVAKDDLHSLEVLPRFPDGRDGNWRWGKSTAETRLEDLVARQVGPEKRWDIFQKDWLVRDGEVRRATPKTVWMGSEFENGAGTAQIKSMFGERIFDTPKPVALIAQILEMSTEGSDLVLDFFAGSGTTAAAVAQVNAADGGARRCISVNLPEPTPEDSVAARAGYLKVSDITWARIRGVMEGDSAAANQGLRTLALSESNFGEPTRGDELTLTTTTLASAEFVAYAVAQEVLLKEGVRLDVPWIWSTADSADVVSADGVAIVLTMDLTDVVVKEVLAAEPRVVVFLEDGFKDNDSVKANAFFACQQSGITMKTV